MDSTCPLPSTRPLAAGPPRAAGATAILAVLGLAGTLAHLAVAGRYGYFRDELYYLAAGHHLQLAYVDFPAGIAAIAFALERLHAESLVAIHVLPALANGALVIVTGLIARELGGRRWAQAVAATCTLVCLTFLATGSIFSMDAWDELWWTVVAYLVVRLSVRGRPRLWLVVGLVAGIGLLTKLTIGFFLAALAVAMLAAPARAQLRSRWPWLGAVLGLAFLVPTALWEWQHGWASLAYWHAYAGTLVSPSPIGFALQQAYTMNPLTLPVWLAGLVTLVAGRAGRGPQVLGLAFCLLFALFSVIPTKSYYLAPAYPMLFAAGAVALGRGLELGRRRWLRPTVLAGLLASGAVLAPIAMPILPPAGYAALYGFLGTDGGAQLQRSDAAPLPQWLADRFGWRPLTDRVAAVFRRLPADQRRGACVFAANYGEAAALDRFGPAVGLPAAISGSNSFYFWGPGSCRGRTVVEVGVPAASARQSFRRVVAAGISRCRFCMPEEDGVPILVVRGPRRSRARLWAATESLG
ncbi:MAG TPA: glycosyltransferase family 39 protein [Candidatus Micrarchaeia archaeon]|nr:glycosyltransferase family 39 protein [Candidatus Micrarchaeia archaeon]